MDTRMLGYEHASSVVEVANWANELIGKAVPGISGYWVVRVIQFQFVAQKDFYAALVLVEVTDMPTETELALKEEDIVVIEQLTSSIDGPPATALMFPEEENWKSGENDWFSH